jgi:hypothetical protein
MMADDTDFQSYLGAIGAMFEQAETSVRDDTGKPPWATMFDPDTAPDGALAWLGQFVGVSPQIQSIYESDFDFFARQRQRIKDHLGFNRGSAVAMKTAAALYLTGSKTVMFRERDGSAYHLTVVTRTAETPDPGAVERELLAQKPAGITLDYHTITGRDFDEVKAANATFTIAKATYATFNTMRGF